MCPCGIKVLISLKKILLTPNLDILIFLKNLSYVFAIIWHLFANYFSEIVNVYVLHQFTQQNVNPHVMCPFLS